MESLIERRGKLKDQILALEERASRTRDEIRTARTTLIEIENAINEAQIAGHPVAHPTLGPPTSRNLPAIRAWSALVVAIHRDTDDKGLPGRNVRQLIQNAVPGIADATVRSHLHRFKKRGLLVQRGDRWFLGPQSQGRNSLPIEGSDT